MEPNTVLMILKNWTEEFSDPQDNAGNILQVHQLLHLVKLC